MHTKAKMTVSGILMLAILSNTEQRRETGGKKVESCILKYENTPSQCGIAKEMKQGAEMSGLLTGKISETFRWKDINSIKV